ncbi:MAG: hypothetical protein LBC75_00580 [Fibromonadaceae bacterium]|jgi:hypothetical protein|nr:hypothetical protein [Fibromonadaceae bacterium]
MKKLFFSLVVALFYLSCSNGGGGSTSSSSNGGNGSSLAENQVMIPNENGEAEKPYKNSGKIYLADVRNHSNGQPILTDSTIVEAGTIINGDVVLTLPTNIDSRFLKKMESAPAGLNVEPLGVEIWFYTDPFRLLSNGKHTGNLEYAKKSNGVYHRIVYWYFSKDAKINGSNGEGGGIEYKIEAKKYWNKIYFKMDIEDESAYITTDLSKVPDGLAWLIWEID